jgi:hypothetical protein
MTVVRSSEASETLNRSTRCHVLIVTTVITSNLRQQSGDLNRITPEFKFKLHNFCSQAAQYVEMVLTFRCTL